jgi:hypothetical protein
MRKIEGEGLDSLLEWGRHFDDLRGEEKVSQMLAREFLRIRDRDGKESKLIANPAQAEFERTRGRHNIIVKARQMGITTWIAGRFFLKTITHAGTLTVQVAHTREAAHGIFRMVQRFWECLPEPLRKGPLKRSRSNVGQMVFPALDSEFRVLTAADENAGRGLTVQNMHLSEVSRWPGAAAETLAGLRASLVPTGELVLESTPNGASGCFYDEWLQAKEKGVVQHFYPWWMEPAYVSAAVTDPNEEELALMHEHKLSAAQIGYRRSLEASYRGMRVQEYAEDADLCFRTSGNCCFTIDALEARLKLVEPPVLVRSRGREQIFLPAQPNRDYIVAVDPTGGGSDGDYAAIQIIDVASGVQCAELQQRLRPQELATAAVKLANEYSTPGRPALLVVERNNHGHGVLAHLRQGAKYDNIYDRNGLPGWPTNSTNKPPMIGDLDGLLAAHPELFRSRRLLEECRTFITYPNGSTGAAHGSHDDLVMAFAIAHAVRAELLNRGHPHARAA